MKTYTNQEVIKLLKEQRRACALWVEICTCENSPTPLTDNNGLHKLIQWCIENAFNIEGQDGSEYLAIDFDEMRTHFDEWLKPEPTLTGEQLGIKLPVPFREEVNEYTHGWNNAIREVKKLNNLK